MQPTRAPRRAVSPSRWRRISARVWTPGVGLRAIRDHGSGPVSPLRVVLVLEAVLVLFSAVMVAFRFDLWGFAMVGVLCTAITHLAFLHPRVRLLSMWGVLSFVVTVGAGARGVTLALQYPSRGTNNGLFLRGHTFASLVPESIVAVVGVAAVTGGYLLGVRGRSKRPSRIDRRWVLDIRTTPSHIVQYAVLAYALVGLAATVTYYLAVGGTEATIGERRSTYTGSADYASNGISGYLAHAGAVALLLYVAWRLHSREGLTLRSVAIATLLTVNAFAINWVTTTRSDLVYVTLGLLLVIQIVRQRVSLAFAALIALVVVLGIGSLSAIRGIGGSTSSSGVSVMFGVKSGLLNRNGFDLSKTLLIIDAVPKKLPYAYGRTIATYVVAPIPRAVWPSKPVVSPGPVIGKTIYGMARTGVPPGMVAELVWNFGIPLALVLSLFAGLGLGRVERWALTIGRHDLVLVLVYALTVLTLGKAVMGVAVGQAASASAQTLGLVAPLAVLSWLTSRGRAAAKTHGRPVTAPAGETTPPSSDGPPGDGLRVEA